MLCRPHIFYRFLLCSPFTMIYFITAVYDGLFYQLHLRNFTANAHAFIVYDVLLPTYFTMLSPFTMFYRFFAPTHLRSFYETFTKFLRTFFGSQAKLRQHRSERPPPPNAPAPGGNSAKIGSVGR